MASIEIHCVSDSEFTKSPEARRLRAIGGTYSACRGSSHIRFVHVPLRRDTLNLIDRIISIWGRRTSRSPGVTVIVRAASPKVAALPGHSGHVQLPAHITVRDIHPAKTCIRRTLREYSKDKAALIRERKLPVAEIEAARRADKFDRLGRTVEGVTESLIRAADLAAELGQDYRAVRYRELAKQVRGGA